MEEKIKHLEEIISKTYRPLLIIKLMRLPSMDELDHFYRGIKEHLGYDSIIFPGEMETDVKIVSILESQVEEIENLKNQVYKLIENLSNEVGK